MMKESQVYALLLDTVAGGLTLPEAVEVMSAYTSDHPRKTGITAAANYLAVQKRKKLYKTLFAAV